MIMNKIIFDNNQLTIIDLIKHGQNFLLKNGFSNSNHEIERLLCDLLNYNRSDLYIRSNEKVSNNQINQLSDWINQRINQKPLQYITGYTEFYGNKISVSPNVLIPRPETERVVDVALDCIKEFRKPKILDVGTGSGCISIAIAKERRDADILSIDISEEALNKAIYNAKLNNVNSITFSKTDFLNEFPKEQFDLIISNPPYISKNEMKTIMTDVKNFEPDIALTDNDDGLEFYRRFCDISNQLMNRKSFMILEVGLGQHPLKAHNIFSLAGFNKLELIPDYNNDLRVLKIQI